MLSRLVARPFVLVHGAGCGPWFWEPVIPALRDSGSAVFAPQLERQDDPATSMSDHARQVAALIEDEDLRDVVLVGHSYGGMVITQAAEHAADRLATLVYFDAFVPRDGESAFDTRPELARAFRANVVDGVMAPIPARMAGVDTREQAAFVDARMAPLSAACMEEPVRLGAPGAAALPRHFVFATRSGMGAMAERARESGFAYHEIAAPHMATVSDPDAVARVLLAI
jgi:pimeloyl-ACP methyl ester carboxylesterase